MNIKVNLLLALCSVTAPVQSYGLRTVFSEPGIRECHPLMIRECQGYGYLLTSLNITEQIAVSAEIEEVRQFDNLSPGTSPIHIPYLCYALAPKCRRRMSYDVRPCKEACKKFVNEASESEIMTLRRWSEWESKLRCNTFKSSKGKFQCVSYNKLQRYAQAKPSVLQVNSGEYNPVPEDISLSELAGLGVGESVIPAELANSNMTIDELLAANEAIAELVANMANQTDVSAMMDSVNQMLELANSMGIPLPEGFDPAGLTPEALTNMLQQFGPSISQELPEGVDLQALMNSGAGQSLNSGDAADQTDTATMKDSILQMIEIANAMGIPPPEGFDPEALTPEAMNTLLQQLSPEMLQGLPEGVDLEALMNSGAGQA